MRPTSDASGSARLNELEILLKQDIALTIGNKSLVLGHLIRVVHLGDRKNRCIRNRRRKVEFAVQRNDPRR